MKRRFLVAVAAAIVPVLSVTGCSSSNGAHAATKGQPDVNGDGRVLIGIMSAGDIHDKGYYESFVDEANGFAKRNGWKVLTVDRINAAAAVGVARNLCRQHVDLIALGSSDIKDALRAAPEPECQHVDWYVNAGSGPVKQTKYFTQTVDDANETSYVSGYAAGLLLRDAGGTKAGFVTGEQQPFAVLFAKGFLLGIRKVVPNATLVTTYTGDFNDSAKAAEAAQAQLAQGVRIIYPYLGGATDAVTRLANAKSVQALTPGTDRCDDPSVKYAISVIFSPGDYFAYALQLFKAGQLKMGTTRKLHMGKDAVPTVKICQPRGNEQRLVDALEQQIGAGKVNPDAIVSGSR